MPACICAVQVTFAEEDASATLAGIASGELLRGLLPWIPLMRSGGEAGIIMEWRRLALEEPSVQRRGDYGGLALVFAELAGRRPVWRQALEGWNMQVSQQVLEWQAEARVEAELARSRRDILRAIELRFHTPPPFDLTAAVSTLTDLNELSRWFDIAITSDTLDAFRTAIGQAAESNGPSSGNGA